jgi:hypothetical protein
VPVSVSVSVPEPFPYPFPKYSDSDCARRQVQETADGGSVRRRQSAAAISFSGGMVISVSFTWGGSRRGIRSGACDDVAVAEPHNLNYAYPFQISEYCRGSLQPSLPPVAVADHCR